MKLVVGLGNPGKKYEHTRHNVGYDVITKLEDDMNILSTREKFQGIISEKIINGEKILFLKPLTFMNLSGNSINEVINFYKLDPTKDLIVIYDDMSLPLGKLRVKEKGSAGGHNGIKSIISHVGDKFIRIKCGIGATQKNVVDFVLSSFDKVEQNDVEKMLEKASSCTKELIENVKLGEIMQKYNRK